ncbi:hypothetical protein FKM82_028220 [Ascaphus truei]
MFFNVLIRYMQHLFLNPCTTLCLLPLSLHLPAKRINPSNVIHIPCLTLLFTSHVPSGMSAL